MLEISTVVILAALAVIAVLVVTVLLRQGSATSARTEAARDAAALAARLNALAQESVEFERSLRQDIDNARTEVAYFFAACEVYGR